VKAEAAFSDDKTCRFQLSCSVKPASVFEKPGHRALLVIMVNPSKATVRNGMIYPDPTVRKCIGFARLHKFDKLMVGNVIPFISTDIKGLRSYDNPLATQWANTDHLFYMMQQADQILVAWGRLSKLPAPLRKNWRAVPRLARKLNKQLYCLGTCDDGHPRHPLMIGYKTQMVRWVEP